MKRHLSIIGTLALAVATCFPIVGCTLDNAACTGLGINDSDTHGSGSNATAILVLIDLPNNAPETIDRVVSQVHTAIESELGGSTEFALTAGVYAGNYSTVTTVTCMDGSTRSFTYIEGENNETRQQRERKEYIEGAKMQLKSTLVTSTHDESASGDFRSLLSWGRDKIAQNNMGDTKVILWSNFLSNGTDCMHIESPSSASGALADEIAQRCQDASLLPTLGDADVQVLGSGYGTDAPLSSFSSQLAVAFCQRISANCHVSRGEE